MEGEMLCAESAAVFAATLDNAGHNQGKATIIFIFLYT